MATTSRLLGTTAIGTGAVSITNQTVTKVGNGTTTVTGRYRLANDGDVKDHDNTILEGWLDSGAVGDFEARVVEQSGALTAGTIGSWLSLATTRTWSVGAAPGTNGTATISVSIRRASDQVVLDTATVTINVTNESSGGGGIDWANISAAGTGTITATGASQTMTAAGTLNFSTTFPGTYKVFKNGVDQGQVASLAVASGNTIHFSATATPGAGEIVSGTFTVSGTVSDSFNITIRDTSTS